MFSKQNKNKNKILKTNLNHTLDNCFLFFFSLSGQQVGDSRERPVTGRLQELLIQVVLVS